MGYPSKLRLTRFFFLPLFFSCLFCANYSSAGWFKFFAERFFSQKIKKTSALCPSNRLLLAHVSYASNVPIGEHSDKENNKSSNEEESNKEKKSYSDKENKDECVSATWIVGSEKGFAIVDFDNPAQKMETMSPHLFITFKYDKHGKYDKENRGDRYGTLFLNGKKLSKNRVAIFALEGKIELVTHACQLSHQPVYQLDGPLLLIRDDAGCRLIYYESPVSPTQEAARQLLAEYAGPLLVCESDDGKDGVLDQLAALEKQQAMSSAGKERSWIVRVLLGECDVCSNEQDEKKDGREQEQKSVGWRIQSENGFFLWDPRQKNKKKKKKDYKKDCLAKECERELELTCEKDGLYINGKLCAYAQVMIKPREGALAFNGKKYNGTFLIIRDHTCGHNRDKARDKDSDKKSDESRDKSRWLLINCLDLESYVASVLRSESWPGWPLEVNKAFAIASRTYVVAMVLASRATKCPYHVKDTNKHQTYTGMHTNVALHDAVVLTRGVFLAYDNKPIMAMFDSCCGGVIPARIAGIDFNWAPYLARDRVCTFCKSCSIYSWQAEYTSAELAQLLCESSNKKNDNKKINNKKSDDQVNDHDKIISGPMDLSDIKVIKKDSAGLAQEVLVKGGTSRVVLSGKKIYSLLKNVKSFCYTVRKRGDTITFKGRGYGHHLGLCQWGAREMVRDGWDYRQILQFYYPNTSFMRLT